jgi:hypothetical protein
MDAAAGAPPEPRLARALRLLAVLVFSFTAFFPVHGCGPGPGPRASVPRRETPPPPVSEPVQVPFEEVLEQGGEGWREGGLLGALWSVRVWYPYVLAPLWIAALALALASRRLARAAGWGLLAVSLGIALFELGYISYQFRGFLPPLLRPLEVGIAWILVLALLFLRRGGRTFLDPEATVSAHALLSVLHGLTYPVSDVRGWLRSDFEPGAILRAVLHDYRPAFWVALAALAVAAVPGYLFRPRPVPAHAPAAPPVPVEVEDPAPR